MTALEEALAEEIRLHGPIPFRRFMEAALYTPGHGYYRSARQDSGLPGRDPFGRHGDFFTAEQLQPVFGTLVAARVRQLYREMGEPADFTVVELGAGRGEMAGAFAEWRYVPVEIDSGELPRRFRGVVFSNEFFDALPVEAAIFTGGAFREQRVGFEASPLVPPLPYGGSIQSRDPEEAVRRSLQSRDREEAVSRGRFVWRTAGAVRPEVEEYLRRCFPPPEEGCCYEANLDAAHWLERIAGALQAGFVLTIDYGFTRREAVRFPAGTLMGYHRHTAREDVLECPGVRDITAHVNFTMLQEYGQARGLRPERFETLARMLLDAGEPDQFAAALGNGDPRRRMQLKTLLFGMGETFRVLLQRREE